MTLEPPWERRALQGIQPPGQRLLRAADPSSAPPTSDEQRVWGEHIIGRVPPPPSEASGLSGRKRGGCPPCHCRNKVTELVARTVQVFYRIVVDVGSLKCHRAKVKVWAGPAPSGGSGGESISWPLPASRGSQFICSRPLPPSSKRGLVSLSDHNRERFSTAKASCD